MVDFYENQCGFELLCPGFGPQNTFPKTQIANLYRITRTDNGAALLGHSAPDFRSLVV
jgi:hypothetical protein